MIKLLIADDHAIVRRGLKMILEEDEEMAVSGEARNGQELLDQLENSTFDVVLLDISMPGKSGLDILKQIKNKWPHIPVLILSMHPEEQYAVRVLRAGASGYVTKGSAPDELIRAVQRVAQGKKYVSSSLAERLASNLEQDSDKLLHEKLSDREYEVLVMIASGRTTKEIAGEMGLSVKTISTYRTRILEKMNMKNNSQLILYALQNHLIQ